MNAEMARQAAGRFLKDMENLGISRREAADMILEEEN